MKQLLLTAIITLAAAAPASASFDADLDGTLFTIDTVYCHTVGPGVTQSHLLLTAPGRSANVYTSTLSRKAGATAGTVEPRVIIGRDKAQTGEALSSMASRHDAQGDWRYLTGINGDFFITSSFASQHEFGTAILGYPNMSCAIDGELAAPDMIDIVSRENALIITSDNWFIDATDLKYRLLNNDGSTVVDATAVNYPRRDNEMVIYNRYMGANTATQPNGRELVLRMAEDAQWRINKSVKFTVESDWAQTGNSAIPADGIVISCGPGYSNEYIDGLRKGDIVKLKIVCSLPAHEAVKPDIRHIIGGDVRILNRGEITREAIRWINTPGSRYQRSVVGFSEDRDMMVFAAVDGTGLTYYECAGLLKALGCYDGLDFDGGGSTAIWSKAFGIYNQPRDGSERAIGNALYFTLKAPADNAVASIGFADYAVTLPKFGSYTPVIYGYNRYGQLVDTDVKDFILSAPAELGTADGQTLMASGSGCHALTVTKDGMSATVAVTVDDAFPATARYNALLVDNYHPVVIPIYANVKGTEMPVDASAFTWTSDNEAVAAVDDRGCIHGVADGTAKVTGSRGDISFSIDVTVQCPRAAVESLLYDLDASKWRTSGSACTVTSFEVAEKPAFSIAYTTKNGPSRKITLRRTGAIYSIPDAIEVAFNPGDADVQSVTLTLAANGKRPVSVRREVKAGEENVLRFDISEFDDPADPGIFPISFQTVAFELGTAIGSYKFDVDRLDAIYSSYVNGVESITVDHGTALRATLTGDMVVIPFEATCIEIHDLQGRTVASAANTASVQAPAAGLYIVTASDGTRTMSCKLIVH